MAEIPQPEWAKEHGKTENKEQVDHPSKYNRGNIEVIAFQEDQADAGLHYDLVTSLKYICRSTESETAKTDLKKAVWYIERYIEKYIDQKGEKEKSRMERNLL